MPADEGFDIIGDIHGCAGHLRRLLAALGYNDGSGVFRHPSRRVIFVGDLIDRGPGQIDSVQIARTMVDAGTALIVAGNHEFNAIAFATPHPDRPGEHLRDRVKKRHQHEAFLNQVGLDSELHHEMIDWFATLPLCLDLVDMRVVHACWSRQAMDAVGSWGDAPMAELEFMRLATDRQSPEYVAIEHLLKGPEIPIVPPYLDKDGTRRDAARMNWWAPNWTSPLEVAHIPPNVRALDGGDYELESVAEPADVGIEAYTDTVPVFFGHYWMSGTPTAAGAHVACTDWSAVKGGLLAAYRWSGESVLTDDNWVSVG